MGRSLVSARAKTGPEGPAARKRSKVVRWQGLFIFAVLCALAAALWIVFVDHFAKRGIESAGTAIVGAKVELDKADVSLSPLGLTLLGLKVTNPDAPMTNAIEAGRIAFHMDGPSALRHKVLIEEMSVEDVRLNTPRKTSGAVASTGPSPFEQLMELPSFVIPNVKDAFEKEKADLRSVPLITGAAADAEAARNRWQAKIKELQAAAEVEKYRKRYQELKAKKGKASVGNLIGGSKDLLALQKQVKADIQTVTEAKKLFSTDLAALQKVAAEAPAAVRDDARRIVDKYSLTPAGLANISRLLFGPKIAANVRSALQWNARLSPFIEKVKEKINGKDVVKPIRAKGRDVRFREDRPLPDFLARLTKVSISLPQGSFAGRIENMTSDPDILGQPLRFAFTGENLKGLRSASLQGTFDRVNPAARKDSLTLKLRGYEARGVKLAASKSLPVDLAQGLVDLDVSAGLEKGVLKARISAGVRSAHLLVGAGEPRPGLAGRVDAAVRGALTGVTSLSLTAEIAGTPEDFDLKVHSDLDEVLKGAVSSLVRDQLAGFENELQKAIAAQTDGPLAKLGTGIKGLEAVGLDLDALNKKLADLVKTWKI
jgi:uncharacterized protein (TIGR03545 family)